MAASVEAGSFSVAATMLSLTQPTVQRAVNEFEMQCDCRFFNRSSNGVEPNWKARQIAKHIGVYFREIEQAIEDVHDRCGLTSGYLRIGALPLPSSSLVPEAVVKLLDKYPDIRVQIVDGPYHEQLASLLHGKLDLIVGALRNPIPSREVQQETLFNEPLNVIVRSDHPLTCSSGLTLSELEDIEWIAPRAYTPARELFVQLFQDQGLQVPHRVVECSSTIAVRGLLMMSDRAALLPARQVELDVKQGLLCVLPIELPSTTRPIGITRLIGVKPTSAQEYFCELLRCNQV